MNADSASGLFLLEWLAEAGLLTGHQGALRLAPPEEVALRLSELAEAADDLERRDEEGYLAGVDDLLFRYLRRPEGGERYRPGPRATSMGLVS